MNTEASHLFWVNNDREGFIRFQIEHAKKTTGLVVTRPVASRWFNLMTVITQTEGDIWIHREKDQLWWTQSTNIPHDITLDVEPTAEGEQQVYICHKPCMSWSNHSKKGRRLEWHGLHPKAQEFLFTEGTLQKLSDDNADYARALVAGDDLSPWHRRSQWRTKLETTKRHPVTSFNAAQRAAVRMAMAAFATASQSNGQAISRKVKNKEVHFTKEALEKYLLDLLKAQEYLCAVTDLPLQLDGRNDDVEFLPSLDRIDSDRHYEEGNLQIVCRFINRWKCDDEDENFRRLIEIIRGDRSEESRA